MNLLKLLPALAAALFASSGQAAIINTEVTADVNGFNPGPYSGGESISVSFQWESGISRDWGTTSASYFETAVDNIVLDVGGHVITGTDAQIVQYNNTNDDQLYLTFGTRFGNNYGTVTSAPDFNGASFEALTIVFRDATNGLFPGGAGYDTLIGAPSANLYVDSLTIYFSGADVLNPHNRAFSMSEAASVPGPSSWLMLIPGIALVRIMRRRES